MRLLNKTLKKTQLQNVYQEFQNGIGNYLRKLDPVRGWAYYTHHIITCPHPDFQTFHRLVFILFSLVFFCLGCNGSVNAALACNSDNEILQGDIEMGKEAKAGHNGATHGPTHNSGSSSTGACSDASSTWEAVDEKEANPTLWVPDHAVAACMK